MDFLLDQVQALRTEVSGNLGNTGASPPRFTRTKFSETQKKSALDHFSNRVSSFFNSPNVKANLIGMKVSTDLDSVMIMHEGLLTSREKITLSMAGLEDRLMIEFNPIDNK